VFKYIYNIDKVPLEDAPSTLPGIYTSTKVFFHATNLRSAIDIAEQGISHASGRKCMDFGILPSFYMTPDVSVAIEWCTVNKLRWQGEMCILVFIIPTASSVALKTKEFDSNTSEWIDLVTSSRRCKMKFNDLDKFDAVYGPMVANVKSIHSKLARPHKKLKFQLASKSIASDVYFKSCFAGAIFMPHK
jgi:hypothetical protein